MTSTDPLGARYTPDEIFETVRQDLAAIPASLAAGFRAARDLAAALCWLFGLHAPYAFAPKFWRARRFPWPKRARHAGRRLSDGERPARVTTDAS